MSSNDSTAVYGGRTLSDRVDDRRRQLLDAGFRILADEGGSALTMRAVTRAAQLSPRYFYESFASREELLFAVFDQTVQRVQAVVAEAVRAADDHPAARIRAAFDSATRLFEDDPRIVRVVLRNAFAENALRDHAYAALPGFVLATAVDLAGEIPADVVALQLDVSALSGSVVTLFLDWTEGRLDVTHTAFVDYCTNLAAGIISRQADVTGQLTASP
ncbi:TetR/AcrR family transcriptional regulator [[Mycobacterium] nativiensis]|uniref:TetR/AcrR family transcriptional regulator n=1 Tax=[Mycobacterium] nativiensis TaxID=2855503 RepID=A0ABU5XYS8_9MYCO|nr:TetR/AcrR family transcriptional regulator [Mycolicibacter sp. MYC340]MEB3031850.1 TetR/AcrR family transcriptional regulator [Mycolicibacter sp. MYC340]